MKKLHLERIVAATVAFLSVGSLVHANLTNSESNTIPVVEKANVSATYYESCRGLKGSALLKALTTLTTSKHTTSVSYSGLRNYYLTTDAGSSSSKVKCYYTGSSYSFSGTFGSSGGGVNREHVWPQSYLGSYTTSYAGSDLFNVRPCEVRLNATRGNLYFDTVTSGTTAYEYTSTSSYNTTTCKYSSVAFDPNNSYRGDIARTLFYVATRYASLGYTLGNSPSASGKVMGKLSTLLSWNKTYSVTSAETSRQSAVEGIQGNRNPFIDHPEFATMIWDSSYSGSGALNDSTGTGSGSSSSSGGSSGGSTTSGTSYTLTASSLGLSSSYPSSATTKTYSSISYKYAYVLKNSSSSAFQFKKSSGYFYNSTAFGSKISKIVIKMASSYSGSFKVYAGTSANPSSTSVSYSTSGTTYTCTFSGSYKYFKIASPSAVMYVSSIVVTLG